MLAAFGGSPASAAPTPVPPVQGPVVVTPAARPKVGARITVENVISVPGDSRTLEARLVNTGGAAVPSKPVAFKVTGPNTTIAAGTATTGRDGTARLTFKVPVLAAAQYRVAAIFAGDDDTAAVSGDNSFGVAKGQGKAVLSAMRRRNSTEYWLTVSIVRTSDNSSYDAPLHVGINVPYASARDDRPNPMVIFENRRAASNARLHVTFAGDETMLPFVMDFANLQVPD